MINREIIYERTMTGSYMKIPEGMNPGLDERLMLKGKLKGSLPVEKTYIDGCGQYWYNISGKQSLDTYCRVKQIDAGFVERLVISICSELEILEWNLIHTGCLMLDPELVFVTNSNREFIFTLYPGSNAQTEVEFQELMEYLLTKLDHKDEEAVRKVYGIYEKTLEEGYSIMDIRDYIMQAKQREAGRAEERKEAQAVPETVSLESVSRSSAQGRMEQTVQEKPERETAAAPVLQRKKEAESFSVKILGYIKKLLGYGDDAANERRPVIGVWPMPEKKNIRPGKVEIRPDRDGMTDGRRKRQEPSAVVYPDEEIAAPREEIFPTVCLGGSRGAPRGMLLYQGAEQLADIPLGAKVVKIGHGREADARIERDTISQFHARIERDGDNYYIEDLNSTNGTCVNEETLVYKERRLLKVNDIVQFADVRYRFC